MANRFSIAIRNAQFPLDVVDKLHESTIPKVEAWMASKTKKGNCTLENAAIRREWYVHFYFSHS